MRLLVSLLAISLLQGCATGVVTILGLDTAVVGGATVESGVYVAAETIDAAKTVGDGVSYLDSGKTLTDRAMDKITGKDCNTWRKWREGTDYCLEWEVEEIELNEPVVEEKSAYEIFTGKKKQKRITGNTCGITEYSDWPCMDAEGCIIVGE